MTERRSALPRAHWPRASIAAVPSDTGDARRSGRIGGRAWKPARWRRAPGRRKWWCRGAIPAKLRHLPHLLERGNRVWIAVTRYGCRFTNEANSYYDFMSGTVRGATSWREPCSRSCPSATTVSTGATSAYAGWRRCRWSGKRAWRLWRRQFIADALAQACGIDAVFCARPALFNCAAREGLIRNSVVAITALAVTACRATPRTPQPLRRTHRHCALLCCRGAAGQPWTWPGLKAERQRSRCLDRRRRADSCPTPAATLPLQRDARPPPSVEWHHAEGLP